MISTGVGVNRTYDLFEKLPDGSLVRVATVIGNDAAIIRLKEVAATTANSVYAVHMPTMEIIAEMNRQGAT